MQTTIDLLDSVLGLSVEPKNLTLLQISLRGVIVFASSLVMLRLGDRRALSEKTAFDTLLLILLASVLARAINGSAAFFATLGGSFVIIALHRLLSQLCCRSHTLGRWIKGEPYVLVESGKLCQKAMRKKSVSQHDIEEDMRLTAKVENLDEIQTARLERSGDISFILAEDKD